MAKDPVQLALEAAEAARKADEAAAAARAAEQGAKVAQAAAEKALADARAASAAQPAPAAPATAGYAGPLTFTALDVSGAPDPDSVHKSGAIHFEGVLSRLGAYRAARVLNKQFLAGDLDVEPGTLRDLLCALALAEPQRLPQGIRDSVIVDPARDAELAELVDELCETVTIWDLSRRKTFAGAAPSESAARRRLVDQVERIAVFADENGRSGRGLVARQAGEELIDILAILQHAEIAAHVPGTSLFARLDTLLAHELDRPTEAEARRLADLAVAGRDLQYAIAGLLPDLASAKNADLDAIGALAFDFRTAAGRGHDPVAAAGAAVNGDAESESKRLLLTLRTPG